MKFLKKSLLILASTLLVGTLSGCGKKETPKKVKDPLVIPTVDVEHLEVNLPDYPTYNQGAPKTEGNYDILDLYEVSDFHGAVDFKESSEIAYPGLARMATYFNERRAENPGGTLLLSSGDMFQGSADSNSTRGFMVNYCMNYMGFDAMAIGNHEFDWTDTWIRKNANLAYNTRKIPYLGINILDKNTQELPDFCGKSTIVERGEYKIGIIGAIGSTLETSILRSCVENYEFVDEAPLINAEASRLREEDHCDVVVLIEHEGVDSIKGIEGVDAIFGGHAHENKIGNVGEIPALATKNYGRGLAHIQLKIDKNSKDVSVNADQTGIYSFSNSDKDAYEENAGIKAIMSEYAPSINSIKNIELGTAKDDLTLDKALKNICTKTMYDSATDSLAKSTIQKLDIIAAFHNVNGGIRDDIKAGTITYGSVYSAFPFDNEVVLVKAKGSAIKKKFDTQAVKNLGVYRTFDGKSDILDNQYYYYATTDFLALAEDIFGLKDENLIRTGAVIRDIVAERIYQIDELKSTDFPDTANYQNIPNVWM